MTEIIAVVSGTTGGSDSPVALIGAGIFFAIILTVMFFRGRKGK